MKRLGGLVFVLVSIVWGADAQWGNQAYRDNFNK